MKIIDVEQGSPEWLSWRRTVITSTDCASIMGSALKSTPYKCWQKKLGLIPEEKVNYAMERGKRLEPKARAHFIERYGINMTPRVVESTEHDFLGASLDGLSDCGKYILEIKCGGYNLHNQAKEGEIPDYYWDQMQHQLLVTGAEKAFYYSFDGDDGVRLEVLPSMDWVERFMTKAREFWKCIAFNEPPALEDSDYTNMSSDVSWQTWAEEYKEVSDEIKKLEESKEYYRKRLIDICKDQNCMGNGIKIQKNMTRGRVDYDSIPELQNVDIEKYRKSSKWIWRICVE